MGLSAYFRLARAGFVLAREGAFSIIDAKSLPTMARFGLGLVRLVERRSVRKTGRVERLTKALNRLGPTYVKFGQTLATRPDIVGDEIANDLSALQDRMDPFDEALVPGLLKEALGDKADDLKKLSKPLAAASIAQVHSAELTDENGVTHTVAVKILRPNVHERFARDLESYFAGARLAERLFPVMRRLKPVQVVETLDRSAKLELDLRFEAASISELTDNTNGDPGFGLPKVQWSHTSQTVLTTNWINGIALTDDAALTKAGVDRSMLAKNLLQSFLRQAIRDGFFHADMHPGNLFADPETNDIIAVDFGIMGRIGMVEQRFLADILYGFITRDYKMMAQRHFDIGYVPSTQSVDDFALALRAIGEPLHGKLSREISMASVLGQLFLVTELFDMTARPELVLLQKSMVLVEGVARSLDPDLNIWDAAEPIVGQWLREQKGPKARIEALMGHVETAAQTFGKLPSLVERADRVLAAHEEMLKKPDMFTRGRVVTGIVIAIVAAVIWKMFL